MIYTIPEEKIVEEILNHPYYIELKKVIVIATIFDLAPQTFKKIFEAEDETYKLTKRAIIKTYDKHYERSKTN